MKISFILALIALLSSSCATLIKSNYYNVEVTSDQENSKAEIQNNIYELPATVKLKRSKENLKIKLHHDSVSEDFYIIPSHNNAFLYHNLWWLYYAPIAYLIDLTNHRRFHYGEYISLQTATPLRVLKTTKYPYFSPRFPSEKGQINMMISLPTLNTFIFLPEGETPRNSIGIFGIAGGLEYFYNEKQFLALNSGIATNFPGATFENGSARLEVITSSYFSLTNNVKFARNSLGYGINYSQNYWSRSTDIHSKTNHALGLTFSFYHQFGKYFFMSLMYRPTFFVVSPNISIQHEQVISLTMAWKFRLTSTEMAPQY